jgi:hypothetical protein
LCNSLWRSRRMWTTFGNMRRRYRTLADRLSRRLRNHSDRHRRQRCQIKTWHHPEILRRHHRRRRHLVFSVTHLWRQYSRDRKVCRWCGAARLPGRHQSGLRRRRPRCPCESGCLRSPRYRREQDREVEVLRDQRARNPVYRTLSVDVREQCLV